MTNLLVTVEGSTKPGHVLSKEEALDFGGFEAGICYLPDSLEKLQRESSRKRWKRVERTLSSGHHSVNDHPTYNLSIVGLPKMLAMVLNAGGVYATSEKSARFTKMEPTPEEKRLYEKWQAIISGRIDEVYPCYFDDGKKGKLAQENARYMTSVFTPTTMGHSLSFRQLNYVMHWFADFIENAAGNPFNDRLKHSMEEFNRQLEPFYEERLAPHVKCRRMPLFAQREDYGEVFDETYSVNYEGSLAQLAQAHRHRTLTYLMQPLDGVPSSFFVPPIVETDDGLREEWLVDMAAVAHLYPQGTMVAINERGNYEDFISKIYERLCGHAQLEVQDRSRKTLQRYVGETDNDSVRAELMSYSGGPTCTFPDFKCETGCKFGKKSLERLI
tara:strand:- start:7086 stop:8243 length:1158 start_codon:yes stop_codon:yes gene_type:complete